MSDDHLKSIIERILRLHAEEEEIAADRREVYAEAKANGYDKTALGEAVRIIRRREKDREAFDERNAIVDLYLSAYQQPSHTYARAHAREATEYPATSPQPGRDPQPGHHGSDPGGRQVGESPVIKAGSEQESVVEPQARNEPGSEEAASGGERVTPLPETRPPATRNSAKPIDLTIPSFLDRRQKPQAVA